MRRLAQRWRGHLAAGRWTYRDHTFWTTPFPFWWMGAVAPDLYSDLGASRLIIFKGDLNYRCVPDYACACVRWRLTCSRSWERAASSYSRGISNTGALSLQLLLVTVCLAYTRNTSHAQINTQ